jgi:hypothetical protein
MCVLLEGALLVLLMGVDGHLVFAAQLLALRQLAVVQPIQLGAKVTLYALHKQLTLAAFLTWGKKPATMRTTITP